MVEQRAPWRRVATEGFSLSAGLEAFLQPSLGSGDLSERRLGLHGQAPAPLRATTGQIGDGPESIHRSRDELRCDPGVGQISRDSGLRQRVLDEVFADLCGDPAPELHGLSIELFGEFGSKGEDMHDILHIVAEQEVSSAAALLRGQLGGQEHRRRDDQDLQIVRQGMSLGGLDGVLVPGVAEAQNPGVGRHDVEDAGL